MVMVEIVVVAGSIFTTILLQKTHLPCNRFQQHGENARLVITDNLGTNLALAHE